jgi:predicted transcriptional regulator
LAYDEWFNKKIEIEYGGERLADTPRQNSVRKSESKIIEILRANRDSGIAHLELAKIVGINRKNLTPYMERLRSKGLVKREKGLRGRYYPTTKEHRGTSINADVLSETITSRILANEDFPISSPFFKNRTDDNYSKLEIALFKFCNKVGAIITYLLIYSMNSSNKIDGEAKSEEEKDLNVQSWLDDAIMLLSHALLPCFKDSMVPFLSSLNEGCLNPDNSINNQRMAQNVFDYSFKRPYYILEPLVISELMTGFSLLYPKLSNELDVIKFNLPRLIRQEIDHWEHIVNELNQQKICRHEYETPANKKKLDDYDNDKIKHCHKCHKTKWK